MSTQKSININGKNFVISVETPSIELFQQLNNMQNAWKSYRDDKLNSLIIPYFQNNPQMSDDQKIEFLKSELGEDHQWNWGKKAFYILQKPSEYDCFTINSTNADGTYTTEALLIAYHPKQSEQEQGAVFYVDYLASAPWNRASTFPSKISQLKGLGSNLLKFSSQYYKDNIKYKAGFLLHSLPNAEGFYMKIGMVDLGIDRSKESLRKFEMLEQPCISFIGK